MSNYWPLVLLGLGIALFVSTWIVGYIVLTVGKPRFILTLIGGNVFLPQGEPNLTGIALDVRIRNSGKLESIATDWRLFVTVPEKEPKLAQLTRPPDRMTLSGKRTGTAMLKPSDFLLEKMAASTPLKINDPPVQGRILFYVNIQKTEVLQNYTIFELAVDDFMGHTFSGKQRMGDWMQR